MPRSGARRARRARGAPPRLSLAGFQRWFQAEILRSSARPRARRPRSAPALSAVVLPSRSLTARERMDIYCRSYFARLHDAIADDYPALYQLAGPEAFLALARAYLTKHPSRHYSLNELGRRLPRFLEGPVRVRRRALLVDVARIERAMSRVFDAEESPVLTVEDFRALPPQDWARVTLVPIRAFELLALRHAGLNALITASREEKPLPAASRRRSWMVIYRKSYAVWRMELPEPMFALLAALSRKKTLLAAIRAAARVHRGSEAELERGVYRWFQEAVHEGLFSAIEEARVARRASAGASPAVSSSPRHARSRRSGR